MGCWHEKPRVYTRLLIGVGGISAHEGGRGGRGRLVASSEAATQKNAGFHRFGGGSGGGGGRRSVGM